MAKFTLVKRILNRLIKKPVARLKSSAACSIPFKIIICSGKKKPDGSNSKKMWRITIDGVSLTLLHCPLFRYGRSEKAWRKALLCLILMLIPYQVRNWNQITNRSDELQTNNFETLVRHFLEHYHIRFLASISKFLKISTAACKKSYTFIRFQSVVPFVYL